MAYQSINPFDGKTVKTFTDLTDAELEAKVASAAECYATWRLKSYDDRAKIIARAAMIMRDRTDEYARLLTIDMGKRIDEARGGAPAATARFR